MNEEEKDVIETTPDEFFNLIKKEQTEETEESLSNYYNSILKLIKKYKITKQYTALRELLFFHDCVKREYELIRLGFNKIVYRQTIEKFKSLAPRGIIIVDIDKYTRDIPDDIVEKIEKTNHIFTDYVILTTDYTKEITKTVDAINRSKDPIIFGVFYENAGNDPRTRRIINDRFYYIGDWVDEFCDLTLDQFVKALSQNDSSKEYVHELSVPENIEELKIEMMKLEDRNSTWVHNDKKSFLDKLKTLFKKGR